MDYNSPLKVSKTNIPGLLVLNIPVHGDNRGWFKENWQREKMVAAGLPDFNPVQNNISFNGKRGTTRGIHAEPWDKLVSVAAGKVFGAWVDLREGATFGQTYTCELDPAVSVFVPRGVGNSYQTLEDETSYSYLVNEHWSPQGSYTFLNISDPSVNIAWPIALDQAETSEKDQDHPFLDDVIPVKPKKIVILGSNGQLGKALVAEFPEAENYPRAEIDITRHQDIESLDWQNIAYIINASAFTQVDQAETKDGRVAAWETNAAAVANLIQKCKEFNVCLVHYSSDYVFDGAFAEAAKEEHQLAPLGVYGCTKAAGDLALSNLSKHYLIRTSWVVGEGNNFVATMERLANGELPKVEVVDDQFGRLTFTHELAKATRHLITSSAPHGTYNVTSSGDKSSWYQIAHKVFEYLDKDSSRVVGISSANYFAKKIAAGTAIAPRPKNSMLDLTKIQQSGFQTQSWNQSLKDYLFKPKTRGGD